MKRALATQQRRFFPDFDFTLSPSAAIKFVGECLTIFLLASVPELGFALSLAALCGFVYARQNVLTLAPAFIIACSVFSMSWWTLAECVPIIPLLFGLYAIFFKLKRNVPLWAVALTALVSMAPHFAISAAVRGEILVIPVSAIVAVTVTFAAGVAAYAILLRGAVCSLAIDEVICMGVVTAIFGYALYGVNISSFRLYYTALAAAILLSTICFKSHITLFAAILIGVGASLRAGSLLPLANAVIIAVVSVSFYPFTKWASAVAMPVAEAIMWLFEGASGVGWQSVIMLIIGVIAALLIPSRALSKFEGFTKSDSSSSYAGIVNRRGRELAGRLNSASEVFFEMSKRLEELASDRSVYNADRLSVDVAKSYCGRCPDREACFSSLGEDTACVLQPIADAALQRGKVSILDMPPFITSRCTHMHSLINVINSSAEAYIRRQEQLDGAAMGKKLMSEQFAGVSLILDSLAQSSANAVIFASDEVEELRSTLMKHNIVASEIVLERENDKQYATALVRASDANKAALPKLISKQLKLNMEVSEALDRGENKLVCLESAPSFEIAYGVAEKLRECEGVSGDSRSILCPSRHKRLFAICDGMGSGVEAAKASREAVGMIEGFYRAGFDNKIILSLVNKLLKLSLEDSFSSLDIAVIDTLSGGFDMIKLGSASSFIVRQNGIEAISCSLPPAGILDGVTPLTARYQLYDGDMLIMMSDGVFDVLDKMGVAATVDSLATTNPQVIADGLLNRAVALGAEDDCTVLVLRLFSI